MTKQRLTVTLDPSVARTAAEAVAEGRAESVSAWINNALIEWSDNERRSAALAEAVVAFEAEHGVISQQDMEEQRLIDEEAAAAVRGRSGRRS